MSQTMQLAAFNYARAKYDEGDPEIAEFYARLDEINALADASPGFVWRLQDDEGNATSVDVNDDPRFIVNLSVWESVEHLAEFTYRSRHREVLAKRGGWFERQPGPSMVLWWIPAGHEPTVDEAMAKIRYLADNGPSPAAFTFRDSYPAAG